MAQEAPQKGLTMIQITSDFGTCLNLLKYHQHWHRIRRAYWEFKIHQFLRSPMGNHTP